MSSPLFLALAVSLAAPDAAFDDFDAGIPAVSAEDPFADVAFVAGGTKFVWVSEQRDLAFEQPRRRAGDLWVNELVPDAGLEWRQGRILCPSTEHEVFSSPRIAANARQTWVVWKVSTVDRDVIRGGELTATGLDCSLPAVHDPGPGVRLGSLQLEEAAGTFLAAWETATKLSALQVQAASALPNSFHTKPATSTGVQPIAGVSLAPRVGGFTVAWAQSPNINTLELTEQGTSQGLVSQPFSELIPLTRPVVAGPPLRLAAVTRTDINPLPVLRSGEPGGVAQPGPQSARGPLLAAVENVSTPGLARARVSYASGQDWWLVDFSPFAGVPVALPPGVTPLSLAGGFERSALLASLERELTLIPLAGPLSANRLVGPSTKTDPSQLEHSAVWLDVGLFAVGFNQGNEFKLGYVSPAASGQFQSVSTPSNDGGVYLVFPSDEGRSAAATVQTNAGSAIVVATSTDGQPTTATFLVTPVRGLSHAVVGQNAALLWTPGTGQLVYGAQLGASLTAPPGLQYGRCGVQVDNHLLVPAVQGAELKVLVLEDATNVQPIPVTLSMSASGVEPPCIAARDRELLVVANDAAGQLRIWSTSMENVLNRVQAREVTGFSPRPGQRDVKNPVALDTRTGWQLAWESTVSTGGAIAEGKLDRQLMFTSGGPVSFGLDDRSPLLVRSPSDEVLVVWQQFVDSTGSVVVRTRHLSQRQDSDAGVRDGGGVEPVDAGTADGGGSMDGGADGSDGGVEAPRQVFEACGCQGSGGPALLALALLILAARRRAA